MPDIVPIVRRPVKKLNSPPDFELKSSSGDKSIVGRKFNLPTEKNSVNKIKRFCEEKDTISERSKKSFNKDDNLPIPFVTKYDVSQFATKVDASGPSELKVAEKRVVKTNKDLELERKVLQWIMGIVHEEPSTDYDRFIQDGSILSKVMTNIVFNSVPLDTIDDNWGVNPALDRVKTVIREIRRYGVVDVFDPEDLIELRNIPKVTKCLAQLSKLAASDKDSLLNTMS